NSRLSRFPNAKQRGDVLLRIQQKDSDGVALYLLLQKRGNSVRVINQLIKCPLLALFDESNSRPMLLNGLLKNFRQIQHFKVSSFNCKADEYNIASPGLERPSHGEFEVVPSLMYAARYGCGGSAVTVVDSHRIKRKHETDRCIDHGHH